jgi:hypothetical protein
MQSPLKDEDPGDLQCVSTAAPLASTGGSQVHISGDCAVRGGDSVTACDSV